MPKPSSYDDLLEVILSASLEDVKKITADIRSKIGDFTPNQYTVILSALTRRLVELSSQMMRK